MTQDVADLREQIAEALEYCSDINLLYVIYDLLMAD